MWKVDSMFFVNQFASPFSAGLEASFCDVRSSTDNRSSDKAFLRCVDGNCSGCVVVWRFGIPGYVCMRMSQSFAFMYRIS